MNRGSIPGFYYDEAKQKYFRILANHKAPEDAKYAHANVNREFRESKKRKVEDQQQQIRLKQTVRRARILEHSAGGSIALQRELGTRSTPSCYHERDVLYLQHMEADCVRPSGDHGNPLLDAIPLEDTDEMIIAMAHPEGRYTVGITPWSWVRPNRTRKNTLLLAAFRSPIVSVSADISNQKRDGMRLLTCAQLPTFPGNVRFESLSGPEPPISVNLSLGSRTSALWSSSLNAGTEYGAISGTENIFILDGEGMLASSLAIPSESRDVTWLDDITVAFGQHDGESPGGLMLWDVRSSGTSLRFRREKPITGIQSPDDSGLHLFVSDNHQLSYYDVRMPKDPLLAFNHVHQGPRLQFASTHLRGGLTATQGQIVAALDVDNCVQIYSLATGRPILTLPHPHPRSSRLLTGLRFSRAGGRDPWLQACQGSSLVRWSFQSLAELKDATKCDEARRIAAPVPHRENF